MPPKEARQARKRSPEEPKGQPSQQLQEQPHQAYHTRTHPTLSPSLSPTEVAEGLTKGASLTAKSFYSDQRTNTDTRATALSTPPPSTHPESSSFGTRKSQKGQRLGSSASTARSPTLSSSAKATSKPFPRVTNGLALPAAVLSSSAPKAPESAGNIWSQSLEDLEALQKVVVDGDHGSNPETDTELDKHQALKSERLPTSSMSEAPAVLPLQSNCYRMEFGGTIYKYGIICEPANALAKRERRLVEKAFLQELCIGHQEGSIAFIDGHTFLTSKLYYGLDNYAFVGTINRRLDKPDQSFRPIFLKHANEEAGKVTKVWSAFVRGTCLDNELVQKCMPSQNEQAKVGSQLIPVRAFAEVEEFDPATLCSPFNNKVGSQSEITRFTEALGCLLRGNACGNTPTFSNSPSLVVHGSKVFDFTLPGGYLGYGLELRSGANSAIRTTPENILRAVLPCHRIFYRPVTVSNFIEEHLPGSIFTSTEVIATVQALLRGLKVQIQRMDREPRIVTISGIAKTTPGETFFELRNADGCRVISVLEYFSRNKGIRVTHSDHPCLVIGSDKRPQYLPTCVCEIIQGQSFRHPVPKEALMKVDKFKSISAHKVNPSSGPCGDGNLVDLISQASSLGALSLHDGEAGHLSVLPEQVNCQKAIKPAPRLPLTLNTHLKGIFRVVFVELGNAPALSKTVEVFLKILERKLRDLRLGDSLSDGRTHKLKQSASIESWQEDLNDVLNPQMDLKTTDVACGGSTNLPRPLIVAFIEGGPENKQIHNKIKRLCDLRLGIQSCCVNLSTLDKIHEQDTDNGIDRYACSLLRKMFAKLENGLDDKDPDDRPVTPIRNATLLVGAHVVAVSAKPLTTKEPEVSFWPQVYCITLSSKPVGSNGTYKITTVLKRATDPEKLGLDILLSAHLDEQEKPRVQLSTLSRLVFYRSGAIAPNRDSTPRKPASRAESQPEDRLPRNAISSRPNVSPAPKGRVGSLTTGSSDSQHTKATNEAQRSWKITEKDGISIIAAPSRSTRRIATNISQGRDKMNDGFSRPLSNTTSLPPYAETDPPEPHNGFLETADCENLFTKETKRLESAISSKYPCARLFYISVSSNTELRLYDTDGQPLVKDPPGPDKVHKNISWIASDGLTRPNDNEWFMLKELTGTNSQKPLQLCYHSLAAPGEASSLENDMRKNYEDTFDASYDYPPGLDRCKMVAPVHFARLKIYRLDITFDAPSNCHLSNTTFYNLASITKDHHSIERLHLLHGISLAHSMPKKFHNPTFSKPASSAHPALATSSSSSPSQDGNPRPDTATSPSVNDLITRLRRSQATGKGTRDDLAPARTVHPSLKAILQVADTPPPRPRPGMRPVGGRSVRGPPGPPPPRSWLTSSIHAPKHLRERARAGAAERVAPDRLDRLPGVELPERSSLLHRCLKAIAANWKWHVNYDQYYLAGMPVRVKAMLLSYLAVYGDGESLDIDGLRTLFLDETELDGATGSEEITHLDLSGAMGQPITFKQLDQYLSKSAPAAERQLPTTPSPSPFHPPPSPTLDSWESAAEAGPSTTIPQPLQTTRFPNLTSLSLSHPSRTTSWPRFLHFATAHLATLTHLSLAFWPTPALTPNANAKITTTSSPYSPAAVSYGCSDFYGAVYGADDDWSEAAGVLMRLSRATYCLKSLDLEGCGGWLTALRWEGEGGGGGVEWCGGWRGVERVRVKAGWVPEQLDILTSNEERGAGNGNGKKEAATETEWWDVEDERRKYYAQQEVLAWDRVRVQGEAVEAWVRKKRRALGGLRIEFETDSVRGDVW